MGLALFRVRLDMPSQRSQIPDSLGFLEMFEAGNTNQLNIAQRWAENGCFSYAANASGS